MFRFIFNAGEGTQRIFMEHKIKLTKVENVFVTHLSTDTLGGIPGEQALSFRSPCCYHPDSQPPVEGTPEASYDGGAHFLSMALSYAWRIAPNSYLFRKDCVVNQLD